MASPSVTPIPGIPGIDISHHQLEIDWSAVAGSGIQYSFIKASEGASFGDSRFAINWQGAADAGVIRGAYHFFRPKIAVAPQVDLFVQTVGQLQAGDLPPVL